MSLHRLTCRVLQFSFLISALWAPHSVSAELRLPAIISDHMVLARDAKAHVWGWSKSGDQVTVTFDGISSKSDTDSAGRWEATLDLRSVPLTSSELVIEAAQEKKIVHDVVVGEVWLASGQSNMEFLLSKSTGGAEEIAKSANTNLRQFHVKNARSLTPQDQCQGSWIVADPKTSAGFSAVAYYFGKKLQGELNTPVGIIHSSWGGTPIEAWMNAEAMDQDPLLKEGKDRVSADIATFPSRFAAFKSAFAEWSTRYKRQDQPLSDVSKFISPAGTEYQTRLTLPGEVKGSQLPIGGGAVWLRKTVELPARYAGQDMNIDLGSLRGYVTIYWNGEKVGQTIPSEPTLADRRFVVPAKFVKEGSAQLSIRLFSPAGPGAIDLDAYWFHAGPVLLRGEWQATTEFSLPVLDAASLAEFPQRPVQPPELHQVATGLFNGMINPIRDYAIRGVLWYQGEQNTDYSWQYARELPLMIQGWRSVFDRPELPFYVVQLPNYQAKSTQPGESKWAEMRNAQLAALTLPNTGVAVTIDMGDSGDIHPCRKTEVGERLARLALAKAYGHPVPFTGPVYRSIAIDGDSAKLTFDLKGHTLTAASLPAVYSVRSAGNETAPLVRNMPQSQLEGFAICGADHKWFWADARIEGNQVVCRSNSVHKPVAVRYAWSDNPTCNLSNDVGLPASPFRTDDFPLTTRSQFYYGVNSKSATK